MTQEHETKTKQLQAKMSQAHAGGMLIILLVIHYRNNKNSGTAS